MTANTHNPAVKKAINIVETMNEEDRYKTIARFTHLPLETIQTILTEN